LLFWFFKRWNLAFGKTKCAICVLAFLVGFFRSGLVANGLYMLSAGLQRTIFSI